MPNNLYNSIGPGPNLMEMMAQLKSNPMQFLMQRRFNIPSQMNDPREIVQYLMNSGQMTQEQFNQLQQRVNNMNMNR